jgi:hypothetical protein
MRSRIAFLSSVLFLSLCVLLLMSGCGSSGKVLPPPAFSLSGNWVFSLQENNGNANPKTQSGFLLANQDSVTGGVLLVAPPCTGDGAVSGTVTGNNVSLSVSATGLSISLIGTLGSDNSSMSGTYNLLVSGCSLKPESGSWMAILLPTLTGTFQQATSNLTSNHTGSVYQISGPITQARDTGAASVALNGNLTSDSPCFTAATVSGLIGGPNVVLNLVDSTGAQIGQVVGIWPNIDNTAMPPITTPSVVGKYSLLAQGKGSPCPGGDSGTVVLSF